MGEELVIETAMRDIGTKSAIMRHVVKMKGTTSVIADAGWVVTAPLLFRLVSSDIGGVVERPVATFIEDSVARGHDHPRQFPLHPDMGADVDQSGVIQSPNVYGSDPRPG